MHLRVWDEPLDYPKFHKALRYLDQTLAELQLKTLFKSLQNSDFKVDVHILIRNLTGKEFATVDFRDKIYKQLYKDIFPNNEEKML